MIGWSHCRLTRKKVTWLSFCREIQINVTGCHIAERYRTLSPVGQRTRKQHCVLVATMLAKRTLWPGGHPTPKHRTMCPFHICTQKYRTLPLGCNLADKYRLTPSTHTRYSYCWILFLSSMFKSRRSKYSLQNIPSDTRNECSSFNHVKKRVTPEHYTCCPHSISSHTAINSIISDNILVYILRTSYVVLVTHIEGGM